MIVVGTLMSSPSSCNSRQIHTTLQQFVNDRDTDSLDKHEIKFCFQQHHEMGVEPRRKM